MLVEPYEPDEGLLLDLVSALKSESETNEEQIEMKTKIWGKLPEELLMLVLASLPILISRNLRVVCKQWQHFLLPSPMFQQISSRLVPSSSPAFIVGSAYGPSEKPHRLYLLNIKPLGIYPFSLDFMGPEPLTVLTSCKSIICCRSTYVVEGATYYYICNPLTRTWKRCPSNPKSFLIRHSNPIDVPMSDFHGLAFDSNTRRCVLVIGYNNPINGEQNNNMEMEIYDSHANECTLINMNDPIFPRRGGIYSKGSLYWLNGLSYSGNPDWISGYGVKISFHLVALNVAKRDWSIIELPSRPENSDDTSHWNLNGSDGNVIVAYKRDLSLWKLNEENNNWSELQLFPRSLGEENKRRLNFYCGMKLETDVVVNSCGWILVYMLGCKLVVFDTNGRMAMCIKGKLLGFFDYIGVSWNFYGYENNNIWWP